MQLPVPEIPAVIPTPLEEGIEMIRANIWEYLNGIMKRSILMTKMPSTDHADWIKWANKLTDQAKRINWANYDWKEAALDALLYQCPDAMW